MIVLGGSRRGKKEKGPEKGEEWGRGRAMDVGNAQHALEL